jgi:four helix bundle protein
MAKTNFERHRVYQLSENLADHVWAIVVKWNVLARDTVGSNSSGQLIASAPTLQREAVTFVDNRRFVRIGRGSLNETQHWLRRAYKRNLLNDRDIRRLRLIVDELAPKLNAYMNSIGKVSVTISAQLTTDY